MADPQILYSNGPINGTTNGWEIDMFSGFSVSDSFVLPYAYCPPLKIEDLHIGVWMPPGDFLMSIQVDIDGVPFGRGMFSEMLPASGFTDLGINQQGFDVQQVDFNLNPIFLPPGMYWLTLSQAQSDTLGPVYWDENSGVGCPSTGCPSSAYQNIVGSIPSEAFTVSGEVPEPSSILLFGSGMLGLAGVLRRKLNR